MVGPVVDPGQPSSSLGFQDGGGRFARAPVGESPTAVLRRENVIGRLSSSSAEAAKGGASSRLHRAGDVRPRRRSAAGVRTDGGSPVWSRSAVTIPVEVAAP